MSDMLSMFNELGSHDEEIREDYVRSAFGYPGSKSRSLDKILPLLPYRGMYCEPFGGSGSVLLARNPSKLEIFNDRYAGVVAFYRCIRDGKKCNALIDRLVFCIHAREEFIWSRDTWKNCEDDVERASRWYYMVQASFGGQGRNFGRAKKVKAQIAPKLKNNLKLFPALHNRMVHVQVENLDWRLCLRDFDDSEMVWYIDPPYYQVYSGMYECEMKDEEHRELLERIFHLKGFVALSGYNNSLYNSYRWDDKHTWEVMVSASGIAETESNNRIGTVSHERRKAEETLYIKEAH